MHFITFTGLLIATGTTLIAALPADTTVPLMVPTAITFNGVSINITTTTNTTAAAAADNLTRRFNTQPVYRPVTICTDANRKGFCATQSYRHATCYGLDRTWNDRVSSVYPSANTRCRLFADGGCRGAFADVGPNRSNDNLKSVGMNDRMSSLACYTQIY
ncbi:hypothetical protein B0J12DRAFT_725441 [Macrophomina phaseolina]|uniref:Beta/gamma crystallin n=1 Tax=Macrophomina phaseolina TaxID=35725 RepID=A0ABQ8GQ55_9PEZI|nr:hypothetical protein B0J12DRAFT_725441 [Macrophomina phaseolina]